MSKNNVPKEKNEQGMKIIRDITTKMPAQVANAIKDVAESAFDYLNTREIELTKRVEMNLQQEIIIKEIEQSRKNIKDYFENRFSERQKCFTELFKQLDKATDNEKYEYAIEVLKIISAIILDNPIDVETLEALKRKNIYGQDYIENEKVIDI